MDKYQLEISQYASSNLKKIKEIADGAREKGFRKNCSVAGVVVSSEVFNNKANKPYRRVVLRDFDSEYTFFVRGEVMEKYAYLFTQENMILLHLSSETYTRKDGQEAFSWKITDGELLAYLLDKKVKRIRLNLDLSLIDAGFIRQWQELVKEYKDHTKKLDVDFHISDPHSAMDVNLTGVFKVDISSFCHQLVNRYPDSPMQLIS